MSLGPSTEANRTRKLEVFDVEEKRQQIVSASECVFWGVLLFFFFPPFRLTTTISRPTGSANALAVDAVVEKRKRVYQESFAGGCRKGGEGNSPSQRCRAVGGHDATATALNTCVHMMDDAACIIAKYATRSF